MGKPTSKGEAVKHYCRKYSDTKDYTLATRVMKEMPGMWKSHDSCRAAIRYYRQHIGEKLRKDISDKSLGKPLTNDTRNTPRFSDQTGGMAKVLVVDIETAPIKCYVWGIWQQNVSLNAIESDWFIITWAAKWLFDDKVYSGKISPKEIANEDDSRIIKGLWELLNEADIVIAHNGQKFDIPKINTRFLIHGLMPPLPYMQIDTLLHIRKNFGFSSNKLDYVNQLLNLPRKVENEGMPLWIKCLNGDQDALDTMEEYNVGDVRILEDTYLRIRPFIRPHPNMGLFILDTEQERCPTCGSNDLVEMGKQYHTTANVYETTRCNNCGAVGRKRLSSLTIKERRHLLMSVPK
jgi:hypothetical protein